ncbi:hypothetical protein GCM10027614_35970 [Micromonospora vulcania]
MQLVRYYRELGFPLEEIAAIIDDPAASPAAHLRRQHELLTVRIKRLQEMVTAIEFAMEASKVNIQLTPQERFEVFGDFDPEEHEAEAEQRWGDTDAYRESNRRVSRYTRDDWLRNKAENEDWGRRIVALLASGAPADGPEARSWPRSTGRSSTAGSTSARTRCTPGWPTCTSPTSGSPRTTRTSRQGWRPT